MATLKDILFGDDAEFREEVLRRKKLGYGRMMSIISLMWQEEDRDTALLAGDSIYEFNRKCNRCERVGHDWDNERSSEYRWCDRCGRNEAK